MAQEAFGAPGTWTATLGTTSPNFHPMMEKNGVARESNTDFVDWQHSLDLPSPTQPFQAEPPPMGQTQGDIPKASRAPPIAHHQLQLTAPISQGKHWLRELSAGYLFAPRHPSSFSSSPFGVKQRALKEKLPVSAVLSQQQPDAMRSQALTSLSLQQWDWRKEGGG